MRAAGLATSNGTGQICSSDDGWQRWCQAVSWVPLPRTGKGGAPAPCQQEKPGQEDVSQGNKVIAVGAAWDTSGWMHVP